MQEVAWQSAVLQRLEFINQTAQAKREVKEVRDSMSKPELTVQIVLALVRALNNCAKLAHKNTASHSYWLSFRECSHETCKAATEAIRKAEEMKLV